MLSGTVRTTQGKTFLHGRDITGLAPHRISRLGLARTHQVVKPLREMTLRENAAVGALFAAGKPLRAAKEIAEHALESVGLAEKGGMLSGSVSIGDLKRLELARALATQPKVLLLDEVMAGLNTREVQRMMELVQKLNAAGLPVLIIDHVLKAVMGISHRVMVLQHGEKIAEGAPQEIATNPKVLTGYLGEFYGKRLQQQQQTS
jgi:branched-chain amino acid transport system ATP-binding protein